MNLKEQFKRIGGTITEDVSTMRLKSNIDQKWKDDRIVEEDLVAWFDGAVSAGGTELGENMIYAIEDALERMKKINHAYGE